MLADAFEALKKYDWGTDLAALEPIDNAAVALRGTANADPEIESQLLAALKAHCHEMRTTTSAASWRSSARRHRYRRWQHRSTLRRPRTWRVTRRAHQRPAGGRVPRNALKTTQGKAEDRRDHFARHPSGRRSGRGVGGFAR